MMALLPDANQGGFASNYFACGTVEFNRDNFDGKLNYNRTRSTPYSGDTASSASICSIRRCWAPEWTAARSLTTPPGKRRAPNGRRISVSGRAAVSISPAV
jgi:hypothetical protein